jgi:hypothetical protein
MWLTKTGAKILLEFLTSVANDRSFPMRKYTDEERKDAEKMLNEVKRCLIKDFGESIELKS